MKKFRIGAVAVLAATGLTVAGVAATASASSTSTTEHIDIVQTNPASGSVLAFGAFNAAGTDAEHSTGPHSGTSTFQFANGTISAAHSDNPGGTSSFNPATCTAHFTGSGVFKLTGGSGAYKGIDGHGTFNVDGTLVFAHTASGCGKQPVGALVIIKAVGPVSFG